MKRDLAHWIALPFELIGRLAALALGLFIIIAFFLPVAALLFVNTITVTAVKTAWFSFLGKDHDDYDRLREVTVIIPKAIQSLFRNAFGRTEPTTTLFMPAMQVLQQFLMSLFFFSWIILMWHVSQDTLAPLVRRLLVLIWPAVRTGLWYAWDFFTTYMAILWNKLGLL